MKFTLSHKNKINFTSLGCPRNLVDSEVMLGLLLKAGYEVTPEIENADWLIVNTCGFLEVSRKESLDTIEELLSKKKEGAKVIVTGCMVSKHKEMVTDKFPEIHYLLGSGDVDGILKAVQSEDQGESIGSAKSYLQAGEVPRLISTPSHFAYLKIAEGCRKGCAFCIIPKIKGPLKSKSIEQIEHEFKSLLNAGIKEIILIAQDLGDFGKDRGSLEGDLALLIKRILAIPGDYWLRLLYLYPDEINDALIELMQSDKRICPYLDMPIQHINDDLLKSMRRLTTEYHIKKTIIKLRKEIPNVHIRTSLIVGFPGETEEHFEELKKFVTEFPLDHVGIFKYSKEEGSLSAKMKDHISEEIKQKRFETLTTLWQESIEDYNQNKIGQILPVIVEGYHHETLLLMRGRHQGQCPDIDGEVIINDGRKVTAFGQRYLVEITDAKGVDLIGRVLKPLFPHLPKNSKKSLLIVS